jgi:hypothetical protein
LVISEIPLCTFVPFVVKKRHVTRSGMMRILRI